jgi:phospholipid N-methyltransferase
MSGTGDDAASSPALAAHRPDWGQRSGDLGIRDVLLFLRTWAGHPLQVGAIAPSSAALAQLITRDITSSSAPVLELGPGTGVFTRALLSRGVKERDLTLIEFSPDFAKLLQRRYPEARVIRADAARLEQHALFDGKPVGAVVSGLPLLSMPKTKVIGILVGVFNTMRPGAAFYQFTYGPRCPIPRPFLDRLGLKATCIGRTYLNVPPAAVYRITRRKPTRLSAD